MTLIEFLRAQLDEDEAVVLATTVRMLAEVNAKRAVLDGYEASYRESDDYLGWEGAMYAIAQPYAGCDGWQNEWSSDASRSGNGGISS